MRSSGLVKKVQEVVCLHVWHMDLQQGKEPASGGKLRGISGDEARYHHGLAHADLIPADVRG